MIWDLLFLPWDFHQKKIGVLHRRTFVCGDPLPHSLSFFSGAPLARATTIHWNELAIISNVLDLASRISIHSGNPLLTIEICLDVDFT